MPWPAALFAGLLLYLGLYDGGAGPSQTGIAAVAVLLAGLAFALFAQRPAGAFGRASVAALAALVVFAAWVAASRMWSHTPFASDLDVQRWILYIAVFALATASGGRLPVAWNVRAIAAALAILILAALTARLAPSFLSPGGQLADETRLAWPITYWNGLGTLAGLAVISGLHLAASNNSSIADRVAGSALMPLAASALVLTFSRGAIAATIVAVVAYGLAGRQRGLVTALLVALPAVACATFSAASAEGLTSAGWQSAHADAQRVSIVLLICVVLSALATVALAPIRRRIAALSWPRVPTTTKRVAFGGLALVVIVAALSGGVPRWAHDKYEVFTSPINVTQTDASRLTTVQNNGRLKMWRAALKFEASEPLHGTGANTFRWEWNKVRGAAPERSEAHSLYLETLAELGIVGLVLLVAALLIIAVGLLGALRTSARPVAGFAFASFTLVLTQAAVDWIWEIPVTTVAMLVIAGSALARRPAEVAPRETTDETDADQPVDPAPDEATTRQADSVAPRTQTREAFRAVTAVILIAAATLPARVALSESGLTAAQRLRAGGDCIGAARRARSADRILNRPDTKLVLGYCAVAVGNYGEARATLLAAWRRDPQNWTYPYAIALVDGAVGNDPRPLMQRARALDPTGTVTALGVQLFDGTRPRQWQFEARKIPFPVRPS